MLFVDDDVNARSAFAELLKSYGAKVVVGTSVVEGLEAFTQSTFEVLVSDIAMPEEDGFSFIRKIRALKSSQGGLIPAIALTAYAAVEDVRRMLGAGFTVHLAKPVDAMNLLNTVANLVKSNNKT